MSDLRITSETKTIIWISGPDTISCWSPQHGTFRFAFNGTPQEAKVALRQFAYKILEETK